MSAHFCQKDENCVLQADHSGPCNHFVTVPAPTEYTCPRCESKISTHICMKAEPVADRCTIPPYGWACTRQKGHDGPCAAVPYPAIEFELQSVTGSHIVIPQWEYRQEEMNLNTDHLNNMGNDGWELCGITPSRLIFKRPKA